MKILLLHTKSKKIKDLRIGDRFTQEETHDPSAIKNGMRVYTVEKEIEDIGLVQCVDQNGWHVCFTPEDSVFPWEYGKEL
jgi:hypothetical protein